MSALQFLIFIISAYHLRVQGISNFRYSRTDNNHQWRKRQDFFQQQQQPRIFLWKPPTAQVYPKIPLNYNRYMSMQPMQNYMFAMPTAKVNYPYQAMKEMDEKRKPLHHITIINAIIPKPYLPATPTHQSQQTQLLPVHTQLHPTAMRNFRKNKLLYHQYVNYGRQNIANISKPKPQILPQPQQHQQQHQQQYQQPQQLPPQYHSMPTPQYHSMPTPLALMDSRLNENINYINFNMGSSKYTPNEKKTNAVTCGGKSKAASNEVLQQVYEYYSCNNKKYNSNNNYNLINNTVENTVELPTTVSSYTTPAITTTTRKSSRPEFDIRTTEKAFAFLPTPNPPESSFISTRIPIKTYYQPSQRPFENDVFYSPTKQHSFFTIEDAVTSSSIQVLHNPSTTYRQPKQRVNRFSGQRSAPFPSTATTSSTTTTTSTTTTEKPIVYPTNNKRIKNFFDDDEYDDYKESDNFNDYSFFGQSFFKNKQKPRLNKFSADYNYTTEIPNVIHDDDKTPTIREVFKHSLSTPVSATTTTTSDKITATDKPTISSLYRGIGDLETTENPNFGYFKNLQFPTTTATTTTTTTKESNKINISKSHNNLRSTASSSIKYNKSRNLYKKNKNVYNLTSTTSTTTAYSSINIKKKPKYQRQYKSKKLKHMKPFSGLLASSASSSSSSTTTSTTTTTTTEPSTTFVNHLRNVRPTRAPANKNQSRGTKREAKKTPKSRNSEIVTERQRPTERTTSKQRGSKRRRVTTSSSSTTTTLPTIIRHSPTQPSTTTTTPSTFTTTTSTIKSIMRIANKATRSRGSLDHASTRASLTNTLTSSTSESRFSKKEAAYPSVPPLPIEIFFEKSHKGKF